MFDDRNHLPLGDETYTIILNSKANAESVPPALQELFSYMNEGTVPDGNAFLQELDGAVESWNTGEGVKAIMTLEQEILIKEAKAREEGQNGILIKLVKDGIMPIETAAQYAGKSVDDFKDQL